jgi:hypothetical protein
MKVLPSLSVEIDIGTASSEARGDREDQDYQGFVPQDGADKYNSSGGNGGEFC